MKYQAIIFDLDGTAIPNKRQGMPSQRLIDTVRKAQGDIKLCAATGRPLVNAEAILTALGLKDPCVITAGTEIINPLTGEILWEAAIDPSDIQRILEICGPYHYDIWTKDELLGAANNASADQLDGHVNVLYVMACAPADAEAILAELAKLPNITAAGVTSWTEEGIDIHVTHREATKEHAISELLKILDIPKEATIGVGDANNDIHLFRGVGKKVAMGNATEQLKSKADEVCESVDNDGLAKLIERYC